MLKSGPKSMICDIEGLSNEYLLIKNAPKQGEIFFRSHFFNHLENGAVIS